MTEPNVGMSGFLRSWGVPLAVLLAAAVGLAGGYALWGWQHGSGGAAVSAADANAAPAAEKRILWWTCSMHPQIHSDHPGQCPICNMALIPVTADSLAGGGSLREIALSPEANALIQVQVQPVQRRFVEARVRMVGKIDYDETRLKYITAWIPGRLDRLFVDYTGVPVRKGDHMVSLYSPELLAAQEELIQAFKTLRNAPADEGSILRQTAQATVDAAREKLRLWGLKPEQVQQIEDRGQAVDHMTIYAPVGGIVIHKNAQQGMYVQTGTRIYTIADLTKVWVLLDAYESDLAWLRYGQKVDLAAEAYPGQRFVGTIAFIDPVVTQATRTVKIRLNADNGDLRLKPGMFVRAVALPRVAAGGQVVDPNLAGKWICPMHPDQLADHPADCAICGMPMVRTESLGYLGTAVTEQDKPLVIPASAPLITGTRAVVYVEVSGRDQPTYEGREILLGPRAGDWYIVRHGLSEGELVVTHGNFKLDAELQIRAQPSMMTPEVSGESARHVPPLARQQLQAVLDAGLDLRAAIEDGDLAKVRAAGEALGQGVRSFDPNALGRRGQLLWQEYAMRLGNDAAEAVAAKTTDDARRVRGQLDEDLAGLRAKLLPGQPQAPPPEKPPLSEDFRRQLAKVANAYLAMSKALADDDANTARQAARTMRQAIGAVGMKSPAPATHEAWMPASRQMTGMLDKALAAGDIQSVREQFALLSESLAALGRQIGFAGRARYVLHCPMAFENRGANWLQADQDTRNPYFGSAMLQCGSVTETLSPAAGPEGDAND